MEFLEADGEKQAIQRIIDALADKGQPDKYLIAMKYLVTGANGYIGRHVVSALLDNGHEVIACDLRVDGIDNRARCIEDNIFAGTDGAFERLGSPDVCIHLAWRDGFVHNSPNHIGDLSSHYKFLTSMVDGGLKHLAVMGTMHEVGYWEGAIDEHTPCNPLSMYGIAKNALRQAMLLYCKDKGCKLYWLRAYYILGDDTRNHSIFAKLLQADREGQKLFPFTTGKTKYDFISVEELSRQIAIASTQEEVTGVQFNRQLIILNILFYPFCQTYRKCD